MKPLQWLGAAPTDPCVLGLLLLETPFRISGFATVADWCNTLTDTLAFNMIKNKQYTKWKQMIDKIKEIRSRSASSSAAGTIFHSYVLTLVYKVILNDIFHVFRNAIVWKYLINDIGKAWSCTWIQHKSPLIKLRHFGSPNL